MPEISIEWLYVLIVVLITLYQFWRNRRNLPDAPDVKNKVPSATATQPVTLEQPITSASSLVPFAQTDIAPSEVPLEWPMHFVLRPEAYAKRPHRYSRRALFGSRKATQDAVVAAVILGPCRALSPYDTTQ